MARPRRPAVLEGFKGRTPPPTTAAPRPLAPRQGRVPRARAVRDQLEKIFASSDFDASRRSREFLSFIVEETLAGRGEALTQAAIATRAFGRRDEFDPVMDPIVRIQAGRLRRSLERYYLLSGRQDPLRIQLPRGSYIPAFHANTDLAPPSAEASPEPPKPVATATEWPSVSISPFQVALPGPEFEASATLLNEELALELGRYRDVRTLLQHDLEQQGQARQAGIRFSLGGALRLERGGVRVTAHLVDHATGEQVWGDSYDTAPSPGRWSGPPDDIGRVIAARIAAEEGVIVQLLAGEYKKGGFAPATPFGAMALSYEFFLARDPKVLSAAIEALQRVVETDPGCGPAWTRLARLFLANHNFELTSIPTPLEQAMTYAHQGVRVDASSRPARCVLASVFLTKGELGAARAELEEALRLSPDALVYLEIIGYLLTLAGDWGRGQVLSRSARERNPHCLPHVLVGVWADCLRRGEIEAAYQTALEYRDPTFFWRSTMLLSCLGHLRRPAEAEVAELLRNKPDFPARGRILIGRYIKFPEVMDRIVDGLAKAGVNLA
jgi:adenylate cyclase